MKGKSKVLSKEETKEIKKLHLEEHITRTKFNIEWLEKIIQNERSRLETLEIDKTILEEEQ